VKADCPCPSAHPEFDRVKPNNAIRAGEIPCKSAGLSAASVETILCNRPVKHRIDKATLKIALKDFGKLSADTAERTVRFWQLHSKIEK
jgi:hypothetical protein